jgi:hypothetical protein
MTAKRAIITVLLAGLVLLCLGALALATWREQPGTNSYVLLADAFLHGRLYVPNCFDQDCALYGGKLYVVFPPLPAVIALPFVAAFGVDFHYFLPLTLISFAFTAWLWWRIGEKLIESRDLRTLLVLLVLFATPLLFVTVRGDKVWFFAQSWGFLFATASIYSALCRRALLAGLFIALAFLCRQMSILYLPFLYVLSLEEETPLLRIDGAAFNLGLRLAIFPLIAVGSYLAYNAVRFGSPLETGYRYIFPISMNKATGFPTFITDRLHEIGPFSHRYFLFNVFYMFLEGPHIDFTGRYHTQLGSFDASGASLFLVTPALLFAFLARWTRSFWFGVATCAVILGVTLFYHSNGFSQYGAQRYALDWLPILLLFLALGLKRDYAAPLSLLVAYSMGVTLAMIAIGGMLAGAAAG